MCFSVDENKPIWMHAEEREEQSKVSETCWYLINAVVSLFFCNLLIHSFNVCPQNLTHCILILRLCTCDLMLVTQTVL